MKCSRGRCRRLALPYHTVECDGAAAASHKGTTVLYCAAKVCPKGNRRPSHRRNTNSMLPGAASYQKATRPPHEGGKSQRGTRRPSTPGAHAAPNRPLGFCRPRSVRPRPYGRARRVAEGLFDAVRILHLQCRGATSTIQRRRGARQKPQHPGFPCGPPPWY